MPNNLVNLVKAAYELDAGYESERWGNLFDTALKSINAPTLRSYKADKLQIILKNAGISEETSSASASASLTPASLNAAALNKLALDLRELPKDPDISDPKCVRLKNIASLLAAFASVYSGESIFDHLQEIERLRDENLILFTGSPENTFIPLVSQTLQQLLLEAVS
jgi:hypothetical protein